MRQIIALFIRNGGFITFLILEAVCFFLMVSFNENQQSIFAHTTGLVTGDLMEKRRAMSQYINAAEQVDSLQRTVAKLRTELAGRYYVQVPYRDTFFIKEVDSLENIDLTPKYKYISAQVVSNSVANRDNWFVINAGLNDGVKPGMGVVVPKGVMGVVRHCTDRFSVCMSILHEDTKISARLSKQRVLGSLQYKGNNPMKMVMEDVPKHVDVELGDMVETSGYSTMFPSGIEVGKVDSIYLPAGSNFYSLRVNLEHNPSRTEYVYVVDYIFRESVDSLLNLVRR